MTSSPVRGFVSLFLVASAALAVSADAAQARRRHHMRHLRPVFAAPVETRGPTRAAVSQVAAGEKGKARTVWAYSHESLFRDVIWAAPANASRLASAATPGGEDAAVRASASSAFARVCRQQFEELAAWPFDQINALVRPTPEQSTVLEDLRKSVAGSAEKLRVACPNQPGQSPPERLAELQTGVASLADALETIRQKLGRFYSALDEEQKARVLNVMFRGDYERGLNPEAPPPCEALPLPSALQVPVDELVRAVQPSPGQTRAVYELSAAYVRATLAMQASCPNARSLTPMGRLDNLLERLNGVSTALAALQPAVGNLYAELSDEQKARLERR